MLVRIILISLAGLAVMLGLAYWTARPESRDEPSSEEVIALFDRIAFSGYGEGGPQGTGPMIRRWEQPVRVAPVGVPEGWEDAPQDWYERVRTLTQVWDTVRGLDIAVVAQAPFEPDGAEMATVREVANLLVVAVPETDIDAFAAWASLPPTAVAALGSPRDGCVVLGETAPVLENVLVAIRRNLDEDSAVACLREGMASALGLSIDAKRQADVFRSQGETISFHPLGRMAAGLVYHHAMEPGMPRAQALDVARQVLEDEGVQEEGAE